MRHASFLRRLAGPLRLASLCAAAFLLSLAPLRAQFVWSGSGGDFLVSNPQNWFGDFAPSGQFGMDGLLFEPQGGIATNDILDASYASLTFRTGALFGGNAFSVSTINVDLPDLGMAAISASVSANYYNLNLNFWESDFDTPRYRSLTFFSSLSPGSVPGSAIYLNGEGAQYSHVILQGQGHIIAPSGPSHIDVAGASLFLQNDSSTGNEPLTGRIASDMAVNLMNNGKLVFVGDSASNFSDTITQLNVVGSALTQVINPNPARQTTLTVENLGLNPTGLLLHQASAPGSEGGKLLLAGQADSAFLGPQIFYTTAPGSPINFAAYDTGDGLISATTSTNLATATAADHVRQDTSYTVASHQTVASLAFHGQTLDGPGTLSLTHLLITDRTAQITADLDFGANAGTLTNENWEPRIFPEIDIRGDIAGTNSLTFRGYGETNIRSAASFSGTLAVQGGYVNLADAGSFAHVENIVMGAQDGVFSSIDLMGADETGTPTVVNRLSDTANILVQGGYSGISLNVDDTTIGASETIGHITVSGTSSFLSLAVNGDAPATLTAASFTFSPAARDASLQVSVSGSTAQLAIQGTTLLLNQGNRLDLQLNDDGSRIVLPGVELNAAGSTSALGILSSANTTIVGDLNLIDGQLNLTLFSANIDEIPVGTLSIDGDLTMGEMLETSLYLYAPSAAPLISIDGDLTLDGILNLSQAGSFTEQSWLLLHYTGEYTDLGWIINSYEGEYFLTHDALNKNIYLHAIPEPTTCALLALGAAAIALRTIRRSTARRPA